jgi:hypothetical protein
MGYDADKGEYYDAPGCIAGATKIGVNKGAECPAIRKKRAASAARSALFGAGMFLTLIQ